MASLEMNKIAAGVLAAGLIAMASGKIASTLVHPTELKESVYVVDTGAAASSADAGEAKAAGPEPIGPLLADADAAKGAKVAKKCFSCHTFDNGGAAKQGPNLWNIVNAAKASVGGFNYSGSLAGSGGTDAWDYESLSQFLTKPKDYAPGTKMSFAGLKKASQRADLIAYMRGQADSPAPLP